MAPENLIRIVLFLICAGSLQAAAYAQKGDGFSQFYADFQSAVKAGDKEKVASLTRFDKSFTWEETGALREVKTKEAFLKNYARMFTAVIKSKIATAKPVKTDEGYYIACHTRDLEYSLYFSHESDGSYRFLGLTVGPR